MTTIKEWAFAPVDVDTNGIAESQTPAGAGNLTLDGALGTSLDYARLLSITTVSDESGKTLTITGTDADGQSISEAIAGPNATTGETTKAFKTISSIAVSAAFTGAVYVGTADTILGPTYPINWRSDFNHRFSVIVGGTINYDVQETYNNVQASDGAASVTWTSNAASAKTASFEGTVYKPTAVRVKINSYSSGATLNVAVVQSRGGN